MKIVLGVVMLLMPATALAQQTTYTYDSLGRLIKTVVTKGPTNVETGIEYDAAGNRKNYRVTGAPDASEDAGAGASVPNQRRFVVVPLNGFTIIPIG